MVKKSEKEIERAVCRYAKQHSVLVYKFVSPSNRGVPDRVFLYCGRVLFIEFKAPEAKPTPLQHHNIKLLRDEGFRTEVIDNVPAGEDLINEFLTGYCLPHVT